MTEVLLSPPSHAVVLRVTLTLDGAEPPVWRDLELQGELTLDIVHRHLQLAMGWQDSHLHRFWRGPYAYRPEEPRFLTPFDVDEGEEGIEESEVRLDQVLRDPGDTLGYLYDFGDDWLHTLHLEEVRPATGDEPPARCLDGAGAGPPEDIGGVDAYNELVAALRAPAPDAQQAELLETYGEMIDLDVDPLDFDPQAASAAMAADAEVLTAVIGLTETPVVALRRLVERLEGPETVVLTELARDAAAAPPATPEDLDAALRPWQTVLDVVGSEGVDLTGAGRLRPDTVQRISRELGIDRWWIGKANREDQTAPVASLRHAAQALRLVRRQRGRLVMAPAGRRVAGDAQALWRHLAVSLPADRGDFEQEAGAAWLLCLAAGKQDAPDLAARILSEAGWRLESGTPIEAATVRHGAAGTGRVLSVIASSFRADRPGGLREGEVAAAPVIRALAARTVLG